MGYESSPERALAEARVRYVRVYEATEMHRLLIQSLDVMHLLLLESHAEHQSLHLREQFL